MPTTFRWALGARDSGFFEFSTEHSNNVEQLVSLAIFDLDNTLLDGDSDYLWGRFLVTIGAVDGAAYERENLRYYQQYLAGELDIHQFLTFSLRPLAEHNRATLGRWHDRFMDECIRPIILARARALLAEHRARGDELLIITATNSFVTRPIATELGVEQLIATEPELRDGRYTGAVAGIPCFREGKVERLQQWLAERGQDLGDSTFYSDSHNDLPLLERVSRPVAVDPDEMLRAIAAQRGWSIVSLRGPVGDPPHIPAGIH
jgi:HAD superfamily hydrolase (TIGR01490 family)